MRVYSYHTHMYKYYVQLIVSEKLKSKTKEIMKPAGQTACKIHIFFYWISKLINAVHAHEMYLCSIFTVGHLIVLN